MKRSIQLGVVTLTVAILAGCSSGSLEWLESEMISGLVWPEAPAAPRIMYLGSIDNANAAGLDGGVLRRITGMVLGKRSRRLVRPSAVVTLGDSRYIVVSDPGIPAIHIIEPYHSRWRIVTGTKEVPLLSPIGLAVEGSSAVWITDSGTGGILRLDLESGKLTSLVAPGTVDQPVGIALIGHDRVVVVETGQHRLVWLTRQGELIGYEGKRGNGLGEFNFPTMVAEGMNDEMIIADTLNFRIQFRSPDGVWYRSVGAAGDGTGYFARPKGLGVDRHGGLYITEGYYSNLSIFDYETGDFNLVIGRVGSEPGEFRLPVGLFVDMSDRLFIADSQNGRIQVFQYVDAYQE